VKSTSEDVEANKVVISASRDAVVQLDPVVPLEEPLEFLQLASTIISSTKIALIIFPAELRQNKYKVVYCKFSDLKQDYKNKKREPWGLSF
jgi:hypothetical protein